MGFAVWFVGNLLLPLVPVVSTWIARKIAEKPADVQSILRDGVLFFYSVAASAIMLMDLWSDRISQAPILDVNWATGLFIVYFLALLFSCGGYFVTALLNAQDAKPSQLGVAAQISWILAAGTLISVAAARGYLGLY